jgi:hypothetical protein
LKSMFILWDESDIVKVISSVIQIEMKSLNS